MSGGVVRVGHANQTLLDEDNDVALIGKVTILKSNSSEDARPVQRAIRQDLQYGQSIPLQIGCALCTFRRDLCTDLCIHFPGGFILTRIVTRNMHSDLQSFTTLLNVNRRQTLLNQTLNHSGMPEPHYSMWPSFSNTRASTGLRITDVP